MLDGRPPRYVTSFVFHSLDLACRVGGPEILIGEKDGLAIRRCACMGATPCRSILTPLSATQWRKLHLVHGQHHLKQLLRLRESTTRLMN